MKRILVPLDGSEVAEGVLPFVQDLAKSLSGEVYLIQVLGLEAALVSTGIGTGIQLSPELLSEQLEAESKAAESYLSELGHRWAANGINVKWEVISEAVRNVAATIIDFAINRDIDLIAMSTHGRSGLSRLVFGSVAEQVVRDGRVPVLLIRPMKKAIQ